MVQYDILLVGNHGPGREPSRGEGVPGKESEMPNEAISVLYSVHGRDLLRTGDRAFNRTTLQMGVIGPPVGDGRFEFTNDDGTVTSSSPEFVCSEQHARWRYPSYV